MGTQDREVSWVKFLSQERIVLVQRETSETRRGCEAGPERQESESKREPVTAASGAETPQSQFVFYERPYSPGEPKERALGSVRGKWFAASSGGR